MMFALTHLRLNVDYKAKKMQLHSDWVMGESGNVFYNSTPSGWIDANVIIADNVPSHLNIDVLRQAEENDIKFIPLQPNSTHVLQPIDVGVIRTLRVEWRKCLSAWKAGEAEKDRCSPSYLSGLCLGCFKSKHPTSNGRDVEWPCNLWIAHLWHLPSEPVSISVFCNITYVRRGVFRNSISFRSLR